MTSVGVEEVMALIANCVSRVCVPWFVIISGYLLLDPSKNKCLRRFYTRRLQRLLIPFAFWVVCYIGWRHYSYSDRFTVVEWLGMIMQGPVYYHLWFFYMLFGMYLVCPFLSRMLETLNDHETMAFLGVWFCCATLLPWAEWVLKFKTVVPLGIFGSYFGFFVFGGWLKRSPVSSRTASNCGLIATAILVATTGITIWICDRDGSFNQVFLVYLAPNIAVLSLTSWVWLSARELENNSSRVTSRLLSHLGTRSLGLYASHIIILQSVDRTLPAMSAVYPLRFAVVGVTVLIMTFMIVESLSRVPVVRRLVG